MAVRAGVRRRRSSAADARAPPITIKGGSAAPLRGFVASSATLAAHPHRSPLLSLCSVSVHACPQALIEHHVVKSVRHGRLLCISCNYVCTGRERRGGECVRGSGVQHLPGGLCGGGRGEDAAVLAPLPHGLRHAVAPRQGPLCRLPSLQDACLHRAGLSHEQEPGTEGKQRGALGANLQPNLYFYM